MLNITTFIDANARRLDKEVYYCPSRNLRYNSTEVLQIVSGIGQSLKDKGIEKGDRVLIYLNNSPEYLFSLLAIWRIGAIAIPTNRILTSSELDYMITDSDAKLIITDADAKETVKDLNIESYIIEDCERFIHYLLAKPNGMTYVNCNTLQALLENQKDQCLPMETGLQLSTMLVMY